MTRTDITILIWAFICLVPLTQGCMNKRRRPLPTMTVTRPTYSSSEPTKQSSSYESSRSRPFSNSPPAPSYPTTEYTTPTKPDTNGPSVRTTPRPTYSTTPFNSFFEDCSMQQIDVREKICCGGKILKRVDNAKCCYSEFGIVKSYNTVEQLCCNGNVLKRKNNGKCCGTTSYETDKDVCCEGNVFKMDQSFSGVGNCCGSHSLVKAYDMKYQMCCLGRVNLKRDNAECCGLHSINTKTHICCQGIHNRPLNARCCGYNTFNYALERCRHDAFGFHVITRN